MYKVIKDDLEFTYKDKENEAHPLKLKPTIKGGIKLSNVEIIDEKLIRRMILKKVSKELDKIIETFSIYFDLEEEEATSAESLLLSDIDRLRGIILNKYSNYLNKADIKSFLDKIKFLEDQIKLKKEDLKLKEEVKRTVK